MWLLAQSQSDENKRCLLGRCPLTDAETSWRPREHLRGMPSNSPDGGAQVISPLPLVPL
jgi:hypothetical protein